MPTGDDRQPLPYNFFYMSHHGGRDIGIEASHHEDRDIVFIEAKVAVVIEAKMAVQEPSDTAGFNVVVLDVPKGFLLDAFLPSELADEALYHTLGRYPYWVAKHGPAKARLIFATQSFGSIIRYWTDWVLKRFEVVRSLRRS
jgi:hypothetical protein